MIRYIMRLIHCGILLLSLVQCGEKSVHAQQFAAYAGVELNDESSYIRRYEKARAIASKNPETALQLFFQIGEQKNVLSNHAWLHSAELYLNLKNYSNAQSALDKILNPPRALERKVSLLRGKILLQLQPSEAVKHFSAHLSTFDDAESAYQAGYAFQLLGHADEATRAYMRALDFPAQDAPFSLSGSALQSLHAANITEAFEPKTLIPLMEALRIAKDRSSALRIYQYLRTVKLNDELEQKRIIYALRLLIDLNKYTEARSIWLGDVAWLYTGENEKYALDICERLLKKKQFQILGEAYSLKVSTKSSGQCMLRSVLRQNRFDDRSAKLAAEYIERHDSSSSLAERIWLRYCLQTYLSKDSSASIQCLEKFRKSTAGLSVGAGARFYLARHYARIGKKAELEILLKEIAEDYSEDYYHIRLVENSVPSIKNYPGAITPKIKTDSLIDWDALKTDLDKIEKKLDAEQILAMVLFAAHSRDEARELLKFDDKPEVYKTNIVIGNLSAEPDVALFGLKQFLRETKKKYIFTAMPVWARNILYPIPYLDWVKKQNQKNQLPLEDVYALIRQESAFYEKARSVANAQGLMQLLPSTARIIAPKLGLKKYDLYNAHENIQLGMYFMRDMRNHFADTFSEMAIAYNAGPGRISQWRKKLSKDADLFLEEIPFFETYQYVRILTIDKWRYSTILNKL